MRTVRQSLYGGLAALLLFAACQRSAHKEIVTQTNSANPATETKASGTTSRQRPNSGTCNPYAYTVLLESHVQVGSNWEWIWSVQNLNPGNGNNGTVQDLSHWGMQFAACFNWSNVLSAAYSSNGTSWNNFTPSLQTDPSQGCMTTPVLKFDFGTSGGNKSYYKVVVSANYNTQMVPAYYKSGAATGCCTFQFEGIGCVGGTGATEE